MRKTRLLIITEQFTKDYAFQKEKKERGGGGGENIFISADCFEGFFYFYTISLAKQFSQYRCWTALWLNSGFSRILTCNELLQSSSFVSLSFS